MSRCAKPNCNFAATASLAYDYAGRTALLEELPPGLPSPHVYALCETCADKLTAPFGWVLIDRRPAPSDPDQLETERVVQADPGERFDAVGGRLGGGRLALNPGA